MKLKPIPRSKAKTAYGLVSDVIRVMDEEPKRVDLRFSKLTIRPEIGGPACGTVCCFAGWIAMLSGYRGDNRMTRAERLLGDCDYHDPKSRAHVFDSGVGVTGRIGTREYAESVIARIKRFQKKNAAYLKARKLVGVK